MKSKAEMQQELETVLGWPAPGPAKGAQLDKIAALHAVERKDGESDDKLRARTLSAIREHEGLDQC